MFVWDEFKGYFIGWLNVWLGYLVILVGSIMCILGLFVVFLIFGGCVSINEFFV